MGNQVSTNSFQNKKIAEFDNYNDPSLGDETSLQQISPIHRYTNYQTTLPFKSIASISQSQQIIQSFKAPTFNKKSQTINQVLAMRELSLQKTKLIQQKQNFPLQFMKQTKSYTSVTHIQENSTAKNITGLQKSETFKSLVINFQDFINIKEQPINDYYEFKEVLGEGAYGQVFKAICRKTGEERAIKKIKIKNMKEQKRKEFMSQLNLLSKLCHPSIIVVYDVFMGDNKQYVVMQYCKGGAVVDMLHKCKKKSQNTISFIIKQLLSALSYIHSKNIVHRDIKLDNIVFLHPVSNTSKTGHSNTAQDQAIPIKIIDFGTAVAYQGKQLYNYPLAGTLSHLSPQALRGILTTKSDIWSVGVLLTILLTGISPFKGSHQSVTKANINSKQLKFNEPPFNSLSSQAKELIGLMLQRNFRKRISAEQALNHPWFSNSNNQKKLLKSQNLKQLFVYQKGNNLISVIQSYISLKRISQQQRQKLGEIFNAIDTNGNGTIEINEIIQIYTQNADNNYTNQEIRQIIKSIDKDKSGKIDFNEFIVVMEGRKNLFITEFLADAFDYYDQDKTGYLDRSELTEILKGGDLIEIDKIIKQLDKDGDKCISKQEFIFYFKNY